MPSIERRVKQALVEGTEGEVAVGELVERVSANPVMASLTPLVLAVDRLNQAVSKLQHGADARALTVAQVAVQNAAGIAAQSATGESASKVKAVARAAERFASAAMKQVTATQATADAGQAAWREIDRLSKGV
jgi:hypothetical protein